MGRGIDLAKTLSGNPEGAQALDDMKDQLLIVLIKKLGGHVVMPPSELDDTASDNLMLSFDPQNGEFHFEVRSEHEHDH